MASMDSYLGSVDLWATSWAPMDWLICNGQLLQINQYGPLYSLLGVHFGGDGQKTFGIPDLRGRVPVGQGKQPNGDDYTTLGKKGGQETATLNINNIPSHTHTATGTFQQNSMKGMGTYSNDPTNKYPGLAPSGVNIYGPTARAQMGQNCITVTTANTGNGQAFTVVQPFQVLNFIICVNNGVYPVRPQ